MLIYLGNSQVMCSDKVDECQKFHLRYSKRIKRIQQIFEPGWEICDGKDSTPRKKIQLRARQLSLKNGVQEEASNYGPISPLPILFEVCERVVFNQLSLYIASNQRMLVRQSGNKRWYTNETSLISTTDLILRGIDEKKITAVVYLGMSKAFDTINHAYHLPGQ